MPAQKQKRPYVGDDGELLIADPDVQADVTHNRSSLIGLLLGVFGLLALTGAVVVVAYGQELRAARMQMAAASQAEPTEIPLGTWKSGLYFGVGVSFDFENSTYRNGRCDGRRVHGTVGGYEPLHMLVKSGDRLLYDIYLNETSRTYDVTMTALADNRFTIELVNDDGTLLGGVNDFGIGNESYPVCSVELAFTVNG